MGVSVYGKFRGGRSEYSLDMGMSAFFCLRCTVARRFSVPFYRHYEKMLSCCRDEASRDEYDRQMEEIIREYKLDSCKWKERLLDFFFEPDCKGEVSYGTAKRIYDLIKNEPDDDKYGYIGWGEHCSTMGDFKKLLFDVYCKKGRLCWR